LSPRQVNYQGVRILLGGDNESRAQGYAEKQQNDTQGENQFQKKAFSHVYSSNLIFFKKCFFGEKNVFLFLSFSRVLGKTVLF
jgi:hypothetical protein